MENNKVGTSVQTPEVWLNINACLPFELAPLKDNPTHNWIRDQGTYPVEILKTMFSRDNFIPIPKDVYSLYQLWRPTPLIRAYRLEKELRTPAKIFMKYEGACFTGSHKLNGMIPQAYYARKEGFKGIVTATGGQLGTAFAFACRQFGYKPIIFLMKQSHLDRPMRKSIMEMHGAKVIISPSSETEFGRKILEEDPDNPGSLGIATSEVRAFVKNNPGYMHSRGELLHQTVLGLEAKQQLEAEGEYPDLVIACLGAGSNFAGISFPFLRDVFRNKGRARVIGVEPKSVPVFTKGEYKYDYADTFRTTPLIKMYTLGCEFLPPRIHAGGLRYSARNPVVSALYHNGYFDVEVSSEYESMKAAVLLTKTEGIVPATESAYALKVTVDEAIKCRERNESKTILVNISGNGDFDMSAYHEFQTGELEKKGL